MRQVTDNATITSWNLHLLLRTRAARRYGRSFTWTCQSCDKAISDRGLISGPADNEHGHAGNCPRLAAAIARWDARWETEWEAGQ